MKVFITHAFGGADESLANMLKNVLGAAGIDGYLAEKAQRYDLLISDKIRQEIDESDWLVAIITKQSQASASVHEEIGYALGRGVRVALMVEEGVEKSGVLVYGREYEVFTVPEFAEHSRKVARSIADSPSPAPRRHPVGEEAKNLLRDRNILSADSANFAQNKRFGGLYSESFDYDEKPAVLFTAIPHDLGDRCDATSPEFKDWARSTGNVEVDGRRVRVPGTEQGVDVRTLCVTERHFGTTDKNVALYREFQSSGFLEWGASYIFFSRGKKGNAELHLCYVAGMFWAFLASARLFYAKIGLHAPFSVILSVRNGRAMDLLNIGDEVYDSVQDIPRWLTPDPATRHDNIRLEYPFGSVREMTDERIASAAKRAATDICNAFGQAAPACYDENGSFSWRLWNDIATVATGGGRL